MISQVAYAGYPVDLKGSEIDKRWGILTPRKTATLERSKKYAAYTLPYVMPQITDGETNAEVTFDLNAIGPRAIQYSTNKYMMTLFPPNRSSFKLELPPRVIEALQAQGRDTKQVALTIAQMEGAAKKYLAGINSRPALLECLEHLFITGNVLLYYPKEDSMQVYSLDEYCLRRSLDGRVQEIILKDFKALQDLPDLYRNSIIASLGIPESDWSTYNARLFTHIQWDGNTKRYIIRQAVEGLAVGEPYTVAEKSLRWIPLTLRRYRRETYGRGFVEDYINVFHALSILQECLLTAAAIATDVKYTVKPGSQLNIPLLNRSPSGSYHVGEADDINATTLGVRLSDLQFIEKMIERLERLIGSVFLINSSVTRQAERVTREEIRMQAAELETAHGGIYSLLNQELLLPLARLTLENIDINLGTTDFEPVILTGLDAMGRASVNDNLMILFQQLAAMDAIPEVVQAELDPTKILVALSSGLDLDVTKIAPSEADKAQRDANDKAASEEAMLAEEAAKGVGQQIGKASPDVAAAMLQQL